MLLSSVLVGWYMIPAILEPMRKNFVSSFGEQAAEGALQGVMNSMLVIQLLLQPAGTFLRWVVFAGILYLLSLAFVNDRARLFAKLFSLVAYAEVIFVLMSVVTLLIIYGKGLAGIQGMGDLTIFKGLEYFLGEGRANATLVTILSNINPFSVWYIITVAFGLSALMNLKKSTAVFVAGIGWLLWLLASAVESKAMQLLSGSVTGQF